MIGVVRGKFGVTQTVSIYELVVGDVIVIEPGCIIPADCVLIDGEDIAVDESRYDPHSKEKKKTAFNSEN